MPLPLTDYPAGHWKEWSQLFEYDLGVMPQCLQVAATANCYSKRGKTPTQQCAVELFGSIAFASCGTMLEPSIRLER